MQIRRLILKGVRNFRDFDYTFEDSWTGTIPEALLLIGPNGSGKTTLLNTVAEAWSGLASSLRKSEPSISGSVLERAELAAIELVGLDDEPLWICVGRQELCRAFAGSHPEHRHISISYLADRALPGIKPWDYWHNWLARYEPTTSRKGSLQNYLYNLKVVNETAFDEIVEQANAFLIGKRLNGFSPRTGDLMVQIEGGGEHAITELSSGEKQVLLMLATITRWLRPGGILLIDEPDLHLHSSLTTAFVSHLRRMVAGKGGQLIIASHATELWRDFTPSHRVELGQLAEVAP